jgi:hypothetical protein
MAGSEVIMYGRIQGDHRGLCESFEQLDEDEYAVSQLPETIRAHPAELAFGQTPQRARLV